MIAQLAARLMAETDDPERLRTRLRLFTTLSFVAALAVCAAFSFVSCQLVWLHEQKTAEIIVANQSAILQDRLGLSSEADLRAAALLTQLFAAGYHYQLSTRGQLVAGSTSDALPQPVTRTIELPRASWVLAIAPVGGWIHPYLTLAAAFGTLLVASLVAALTETVLRQPIRLRRKVAERTAELASSNRALSAEIVERKLAQTYAAQVNRLYGLLSQTNGAIIHATDCATLFQRICHIAVEQGGYPLAAIALNDGAPGSWSALAQRDALIQVPDCERAADCASSEGACAQARACGFASHVQFPLKCGQLVIGSFCLFSYEDDFFDSAQLRLLAEMTNDVSFAVENIKHEQLRMQGEEKLRKLSRAVEQSANAVIITDRDGVIEYVNPWFTKITGYSAAEVVGLTPSIFKSGATLPETYKRLWDTLLSGKEWHGELYNTKKNGDLYWCLEAISPLKNEAGEVTHFVAITEDISERKQSEQTIRHLAFHDALTGLPNRRLFRDRLEQAIAAGQRNKTRFALMLLDLDHFKTVNDTLGHDAGDELLIVVATRLGERIRATDTLARMGGDEFALLACDISHPDDAARLAGLLQQALSQPIVIQGRELYLSTSVGITMFPDDTQDVEALVKHADIALYRAKDMGRDNFQFFTADMNRKIVERMNLVNNMRVAIERQQFVLHYQPQVDMASGAIHSVEALIRWHHPEMGVVAPGQFIALAEETGMITPIGEWVLRTACAQARSWQLAGMPLRVAVNLSGRQFLQGDLAAKIAAILDECGLDASLLEVEITESMLMQDTAQTNAALTALHRLGLKISIDDFGTGYSSLSYLKRMPIDILKIDQSFVRDIHTDPDDRSIVTAVIALAHSLHLQVVAEGVETPEQLAFLRSQDCDTVQGYLFSRPVPAEDVLALLHSLRVVPA